jgi:uncharacterized iron-regulated protein
MRWFALVLTGFLAPAWAGADSIEVGRLDALPAAEVVVLGEVHDNPVHHLNQARAVRAIRPAALVWEMLTREQAARMPAERSDEEAVAVALGWAETG